MPIFLKTLKERWLSFAIYTGAAVLFAWMYISFFPAFADQAEDFEKLLESFPSSFMEAFGFSDASLAFSSLENFMATENFSFVWPFLLIAMAIAIGGYSIAGEIENKTIEIILAQPLSRTRIFFEKYLAGGATLILFTLISVLSIIPIAALYDVSYEADKYVAIAILGGLFGLATFSLSSMFSAIFSEKGKAYFITTGIIILMYVANIVSNIKESLENLQYISFFHYFDSNKILGDGDIDALPVAVFLGVAVIATLVGWLVFQKRDVAVS